MIKQAIILFDKNYQQTTIIELPMDRRESMGKQFTIKFNKNSREDSSDKNLWDIRLAQRIAAIFESNPMLILKEKKHWQLGDSNDWFLRIDEDNNEISIHGRYLEQDEDVEYLRHTIILLMGWKRFN